MKSFGLGKLVWAIGAVSVLSCGGDGGGEDNTPIVVEDGDYHHFVTDTLKLPDTPTEAEAISFDLDGNGTVDLGVTGLIPTIKGLLMQNGTDLDVSLQEAITTDGQIVILHSVRANDLARDSSVQWQVYLGSELVPPLPADQFTGNGSFTVSASSPGNAKLTGRIGPTSLGSQF